MHLTPIYNGTGDRKESSRPAKQLTDWEEFIGRIICGIEEASDNEIVFLFAPKTDDPGHEECEPVFAVAKTYTECCGEPGIELRTGDILNSVPYHSLLRRADIITQAEYEWSVRYSRHINEQSHAQWEKETYENLRKKFEGTSKID